MVNHTDLRVGYHTLPKATQEKLESYLKNIKYNTYRPLFDGKPRMSFTHSDMCSALIVHKPSGPLGMGLEPIATKVCRHWNRKGLVRYDFHKGRWFFLDGD